MPCCPAIETRTVPAARSEPRPEESKGIYLKRVEFLDGRVQEELLSEIHGVKTPFKHYEIWREISLPGRARQQRSRAAEQDNQGSSTPPPPSLALSLAVPEQKRQAVSLGQLIRQEAARPQHVGQAVAAPLNLTIAIKDIRQLPEVLQTVRMAQQTMLKGREVTVERVFLVTNPQRVDDSKILLAEILPTEELSELRQIALAEETEQAADLPLAQSLSSAQKEQVGEAISVLQEIRQKVAAQHEIADAEDETAGLADQLSTGIRQSSAESLSQPEAMAQNQQQDVAQVLAIENPLSLAYFTTDAFRHEAESIATAEGALKHDQTDSTLVPDSTSFETLLDSEPVVISMNESIPSEQISLPLENLLAATPVPLTSNAHPPEVQADIFVDVVLPAITADSERFTLRHAQEETRAESLVPAAQLPHETSDEFAAAIELIRSTAEKQKLMPLIDEQELEVEHSDTQALAA